MKISRIQLRKSLEILKHLDVATVSPFVGVEWSETDVAFQRTSSLGVIRNMYYKPSNSPIAVSYNHLRESMEAIKGDDLTMERGKIGTLRLRPGDTTDGSVVDVFTTRPDSPWQRAHNVGQIARTFDPLLFQGINIRPYAMGGPVVLKANKLMVPTLYGTIVRHELVDVAYPYPRDVFLRAIVDQKIDALSLTDQGYWSAIVGGFEILISGHRLGESIFDECNVSATKIGELSAKHFVDAVDSAARWAGDEVRAVFSLATGFVSTKNSMGNLGQFSIGTSLAAKTFEVTQKTAKTLATVLSQSGDEVIHLSEVSDNTLRLKRGLWEFNFKIYR